MSNDRSDQPRSKASQTNGVNVPDVIAAWLLLSIVRFLPGESETASTQVEAEGKNWRAKLAQKLGWDGGKLSRVEGTIYAWCSSFLPALLLATMLSAASLTWFVVLAVFMLPYVACLVVMFYLSLKSADQSGKDSVGQNPIDRTGLGVFLAVVLAVAAVIVNLFLSTDSLPGIAATLAIGAASALVSAMFFTLHPHSRK